MIKFGQFLVYEMAPDAVDEYADLATFEHTLKKFSNTGILY